MQTDKEISHFKLTDRDVQRILQKHRREASKLDFVRQVKRCQERELDPSLLLESALSSGLFWIMIMSPLTIDLSKLTT